LQFLSRAYQLSTFTMDTDDGLTSLVSSGSHISNKRYNAHSTQRIRFFWFCWASLVPRVCGEIDGQSGCLSKSSSRRLVRKTEAFELVCPLCDCNADALGLLIAQYNVMRHHMLIVVTIILWSHPLRGFTEPLSTNRRCVFVECKAALWWFL